MPHADKTWGAVATPMRQCFVPVSCIGHGALPDPINSGPLADDSCVCIPLEFCRRQPRLCCFFWWLCQPLLSLSFLYKGEAVSRGPTDARGLLKISCITVSRPLSRTWTAGPVCKAAVEWTGQSSMAAGAAQTMLVVAKLIAADPPIQVQIESNLDQEAICLTMKS